MNTQRPRLLRFSLAAVLVAAVNLGYIVIRQAVVLPLVGDSPLADVLSLVWPVIATALLAPHAGYRRRDALAWIIPPLGFLLVLRLSWRVANLPHRDWPDRRTG